MSATAPQPTGHKEPSGLKVKIGLLDRSLTPQLRPDGTMVSAFGMVLKATLPPKQSRRLFKLGQAIDTELGSYHKTRDQLIEQYGGVPNEKTGIVEFPVPEKQMECFQRIQELDADEVTLPGFEKIRLSELEGKTELSGQDHSRLEWLIEDDTEEVEKADG